MSKNNIRTCFLRSLAFPFLSSFIPFSPIPLSFLLSHFFLPYLLFPSSSFSTIRSLQIQLRVWKSAVNILVYLEPRKRVCCKCSISVAQKLKIRGCL